MAGSLDNFVKKVMQNSVKVKHIKEPKFRSEINLEKEKMIENIMRAKKERNAFLI
jgi:hypothetical protein